MSSKISLAINIAALVASSALVGLSIAAIALAADADELIKAYFPPGRYGWSMSHYTGHFDVFLRYNRSSEIKTFVASALSLQAGLVGVFAFGLLHKRQNQLRLLLILFVGAALACVVGVVCVAWSAVAEVSIKKNTCWFNDGATPNATYTCSIENAACNALRFTDDPWADGQDLETELNTACLEFRHARMLVIPLVVFSLVLSLLYAAQVWIAKKGETLGERADTWVRSLQQEE